MPANESSKPKIPELPPEPPELVQKRDRLVSELEKSAKASTGVLQQVMRKMHSLLVNTRPGASLDEQLYQDVKDAFSRYAKDTASGPTPPILMEAVEWLAAYVSSMGFSPEGSAPAAQPAAAPVAPAAPAASAARTVTKDGFESGPAKRPSLSPEAIPPAPAVPKAPQAKPAEGDSFKAWTKNPGLGKVKG